GEGEGGGASLERVQPAGEVVEARLVVRLLQLDEVLGDPFGDLLALVEEPREQLLHHRIKHRASPTSAGPSAGAGRAGSPGGVREASPPRPRRWSALALLRPARGAAGPAWGSARSRGPGAVPPGRGRRPGGPPGPPASRARRAAKRGSTR